MLEYSNYTKPTRIGHQADQETLTIISPFRDAFFVWPCWTARCSEWKMSIGSCCFLCWMVWLKMLEVLLSRVWLVSHDNEQSYWCETNSSTLEALTVDKFLAAHHPLSFPVSETRFSPGPVGRLDAQSGRCPIDIVFFSRGFDWKCLKCCWAGHD